VSQSPKNSFFDALSASLKAATQPSNYEVAPAAIVWTDADGQWIPLMAALRGLMPTLYTLGAYDAAQRTGPSIWLKCVVGRSVPESPAVGDIPIFYLPRVSRQQLRAGGDCPPHLQPLVELQFRGRVWHQSNGQDWTVRAFLTSDHGLGLDVAQDTRTEEAFLRVLPLLVTVDLQQLRGRRLDAGDFDKLAVQDPIRDMLLWLNSPASFEAAAKEGKWESFRGICHSEFGLNPDKVPPPEIAGRIILGDPKLEGVWKRFEEAPHLYSGVAKVMRQPSGMDTGKLVFDLSRDPRMNENQEAELRSALETVVNLAHGKACQRILELEARHSERRKWVWARLDFSPWAITLEPLARLANQAKQTLGGATLDAACDEYASVGWLADEAAIEAMACFSSGPNAALQDKLVKVLYETWLDASARHFQMLVVNSPAEARQAVEQPKAEKDTCILFIDGLRFDLAQRLAKRLEAQSMQVLVDHRMAPLPTVTATAKPAATPIHDGIAGGTGEDFTPQIKTASGWKPLTAPLLRNRLADDGVEVFSGDDLGFSLGGSQGGWFEFGKIDEKGHSLQTELAHSVDAEIGKILDRVTSLLDSGWKRVRVVTDHGWLLLPGGLPKVDLPGYLAETKWSRCARIQGSPELQFPVASWYWDTNVRIASPPGISAFRAGESYSHGGISPQECVIPELVVSRGAGATDAVIEAIEWHGFRCRVRVESNDPQVQIDIRTNWKQKTTSIVAATKAVGSSGDVSLVVPNDALEGAAAFVVLLDANGVVLTSRNTCVGGGE
jgi:hypothetical protein